MVWLANRVLASFLYGVRPGEYGLRAGVTLLLVVAALAASHGPARPTARLDPVDVLRAD